MLAGSLPPFAASWCHICNHPDQRLRGQSLFPSQADSSRGLIFFLHQKGCSNAAWGGQELTPTCTEVATHPTPGCKSDGTTLLMKDMAPTPLLLSSTLHCFPLAGRQIKCKRAPLGNVCNFWEEEISRSKVNPCSLLVGGGGGPEKPG